MLKKPINIKNNMRVVSFFVQERKNIVYASNKLFTM